MQKVVLPGNHNFVLPKEIFDDLKKGHVFELSWDRDDKCVNLSLMFIEPESHNHPTLSEALERKRCLNTSKKKPRAHARKALKAGV